MRFRDEDMGRADDGINQSMVRMFAATRASLEAVLEVWPLYYK